MSDSTIGIIAAGIPIGIYIIFRFFFAQRIVDKLVEDDNHAYNIFPQFNLGGINNLNDSKVETFKELVTWKKIENFGGLIVNVLRLSVGPSSIPNQILRTVLVFPLLIYIAVFCVAEMWNLNYLHWFYIFLIVGTIGILFIEASAEIFAMKFFGETTRNIASLLFSVMISAVILSFGGIFTPVHLINPEEMRIAIIVIAIIGLLVFFVDWMQPGFRILFLKKKYIFGILVALAVAIIILFGFLGYGEEKDKSSSSARIYTPVSSTSTNKQYAPAPVGERECAHTSIARGESLISVSPTTGCWSDYIQIPGGVWKYKTRSDACFSAWFPTNKGSDYVESEKGRIFSCDEILQGGLSQKGKKFRVKSDVASNKIELSW